MAKPLRYYIGVAEQAAGRRLDARTDSVEVVNDAGHHLVAMHSWPWLERPSVALDFVADQNYVTLPSDFSQLIGRGIVGVRTTRVAVTFTTLPDLELRRQATESVDDNYYVALEYATQANTASNPAGARLAVWPTPSANSTGALQCSYRAGWIRLDDAEDVPNVPANVEYLLVEIVRAFARSFVAEPGKDQLQEDLVRIEKGPIASRLRAHYGSAQNDLGMMTGGIVEQFQPLIRNYTSITTRP